jgi:DNA-binding GntR family transcriptional regulator
MEHGAMESAEVAELADMGAAPGSAGATMACIAYERLEEMIILGQLEPRTRLSEHMLSQALSLGRTPIREALQKLRENHLVEIRARSGVFVTEVNFRDQFLVMEVRWPLECMVARRAARMATLQDREAFAEIARSMRAVAEAGDKVGLMKVDREFKDLSLKVVRNKYLAAALTPIHANARRFYFSHLKTTNVPIGRAHAVAIEAISQGDEAGAVAATELFLADMEAFMKNALADAVSHS